MPQAQTSTLLRSLRKHVDVHQTNQVSWPDDAAFCVVYNMSTWPCGWTNDLYIRFFVEQDGLDEWIKNMEDWSLCEDNYFAFQAHEWDLGPNVMIDVCRGPERIRSDKKAIV